MVIVFGVRSTATRQGGSDMSADELPIDDYPVAWQPKERKQRDAERREFELAVAALPSEELERIRKGRD